jgi:hypothetical protein
MGLPEPKQSSLAEFVQSLIETKLVSLPMRVGVTGHRVLGDKAGDWVGQQLDGLFSNLAASEFDAGSQLAEPVHAPVLVTD